MQVFLTLALLVSLIASYLWLAPTIENTPLQPEEYQINLAQAPKLTRQVTGLSQYSSIDQKPLFIQERKLTEKPPEKKRVINKTKVKKLNIQALGIALAGEGFIAVIKDLNTGKVKRLKINDQLYGWSLSTVAEGQFTFKKGKLEKAIKFRN